MLSEPSQITWKKINYYDMVYEHAQNIDQNKYIGMINSLKSSRLSSKTSATVARGGQHGKKAYQNSSLSQRIYDLKLTSYSNYVMLAVVWTVIFVFLMGTIIVTQT